MNTRINGIDWALIYQQRWVDVPDCWQTCGSYCCQNFAGRHLNLLEKDAVSLPLTASEWHYYHAQGGIRNITHPPKKRDFILANGRCLSLYFLSCTCQGLCDPHSLRPLICRLYPYFPIVKADGTIEGFDYVALMDIFYQNPQQAHPCTLVRQQAEQVQAQLRRDLPLLLSDPLMVFLCQLAKAFIDRFRAVLPMRLDTLDEPAKNQFYRQYEWYLLSGKPWRTAEFQAAAVHCYAQVKQAFGYDFLPLFEENSKENKESPS